MQTLPGQSWLILMRLLPVTVLCLILFISAAGAAPTADLWPRWQVSSPESEKNIDHTPWGNLLEKYLVTDHPSGINRFRYAAVTPADRQNLARYINTLEQVKVTSLRKKEQLAYWINLYNSLTVKVVLDHYPVESIRDIDISPGWFSNGPWDARLVRIEGEMVSLNDIEHRILRPIFRDNRIHYAVNCASLGCPDLQPVPFTAENTEALLNRGAEEYINSPRGAKLVNGTLQVSSIYKWFQEDFGGSEEGVIRHLDKYAGDKLADILKTYDKGLRYTYDWSLNEP